MKYRVVFYTDTEPMECPDDVAGEVVALLTHLSFQKRIGRVDQSEIEVSPEEPDE